MCDQEFMTDSLVDRSGESADIDVPVGSSSFGIDGQQLQAFIEWATDIELLGYDCASVLSDEPDDTDYERLYHPSMALGFMLHDVRDQAKVGCIVDVNNVRNQVLKVQSIIVECRAARAAPSPPSMPASSRSGQSGKGKNKGKSRKCKQK